MLARVYWLDVRMEIIDRSDERRSKRLRK